MDLADVKATVVKAAPGFGDIWVNCFDWRQNGNIITAKPRYPMSEMCFNTVKKVFRKLGGRYVGGRDRTSYFELVLKQEAEQNGVGQHLLSHPYAIVGEGQFSPHFAARSVFLRLENQLNRLTVAGTCLTKEA